jgi:hypothetical protein
VWIIKGFLLIGLGTSGIFALFTSKLGQSFNFQEKYELLMEITNVLKVVIGLQES